MLFLGWELVGLCSYLLIGFWFTKPTAAAAAKKAFVVNRIGDLGFMVALMLVFTTFGTLSYSGIFERAGAELTTGLATAIGLLILVGAAGKSAQIPLYVWLPDAMEGPTPVSALIHAATMVTAGVYVIARSAAIYDLSPVAQTTVATIGAFTAIWAASIAIAQRDIKKVLAYSTISQLGYMFLAVGTTAYVAGIFHLMTHAFFKALLFLGAGSVIHAMSDEQDMHNMGGLFKKMPTTAITMGIATLAIAGIPPLAGFWSKDEILASVYARGGWFSFLWIIGLVTALITAFYMTRQWVLVFLGEPRWGEDKHPHESPRVMTAPLIVLALLAVVGGLINTPFFTTLETFPGAQLRGGAHAASTRGRAAAADPDRAVGSRRGWRDRRRLCLLSEAPGALARLRARLRPTVGDLGGGVSGRRPLRRDPGRPGKEGCRADRLRVRPHGDRRRGQRRGPAGAERR